MTKALFDPRWAPRFLAHGTPADTCPVVVLVYELRIRQRTDSHLRSSSLAFFAEAFDDLRHFLASSGRINLSSPKTHAHFLMCARHEQSLKKEMPHVKTHEHATVTATLLLGRVTEVHKADRQIQQSPEFPRHICSFPLVSLV